MNDDTLEAVAAIKDYVELQKALCDEFGVAYLIFDKNHLLDAPKNGALTISDDYWEFQRHGSGICFRSATSGKIVDVTDGVFTCPDCCDGWRLIEYFESINVRALVFHGNIFETSNEKALKALLGRMEEANILERDQLDSKYFLFNAHSKN